MRNFSIVLSILGFAFLLFGTVMSFWIADPALAKATTFIYGILITVSLFLVANSLPSTEDKLKCKYSRDEHENTVWRRIEDMERNFYDESERTNRRIDEVNTDLFRELDTVRGEMNCKHKK